MDLPRRAGEPGADDGAPYCSELYSVLSVQVSTLENLSLFERDCLAAWLVARLAASRPRLHPSSPLSLPPAAAAMGAVVPPAAGAACPAPPPPPPLSLSRWPPDLESQWADFLSETETENRCSNECQKYKKMLQIFAFI